MRQIRACAVRSRTRLLLSAALLVAGTGCRALTETDDDRRCRRLNAFNPDAAQMRVGETRRFQAAGFHPNGPGSCVSTMRGGFTYSTDAPAVASVGSTTGVVTALGVGTTYLRARWRVEGAEYRGWLELRVSP
jgi:hypothetical protein